MENIKMRRRQDLLGARFGRLTVICAGDRRTKSRGMYWLCKCDCGNIKEISAQALKRGATVSCGCYNKEVIIKRNTIHGHEVGRKSITYISWEKMMSRCYREKDCAFKYYGNRGIEVCLRWHTFKHFLEDMGERPDRTHTIDRINYNMNYEPNNYRWATHIEQLNNTSRNKYIEYRGEKMTIAQLARKYEIKYDTLFYRIEKYKWSIENSIKIPVSKSNSRKGY